MNCPHCDSTLNRNTDTNEYVCEFCHFRIDETDDLTKYTVKHYTDYVSHPGKFQGESAYVPYMWQKLMTWGESPDDEYAVLWALENGYTEDDLLYNESPYSDELEPCLPLVYRFDVRPEDRAIFPDLHDVNSVWLKESEYGFVSQVHISYLKSHVNYISLHIYNGQPELKITRHRGGEFYRNKTYKTRRYVAIMLGIAERMGYKVMFPGNSIQIHKPEN